MLPKSNEEKLHDSEQIVDSQGQPSNEITEDYSDSAAKDEQGGSESNTAKHDGDEKGPDDEGSSEGGDGNDLEHESEYAVKQVDYSRYSVNHLEDESECPVKQVDYRVPTWFLEHNVKLISDLDKLEPRIKLTSLDDSSSEATSTNDTQIFEVAEDALLELRDMMASSFMTDEQGRLPYSAHTIVIRLSPHTPSEFSNETIFYLAKDMKATIISVDLEDLEDIGWDFKGQEQAVDPNDEEDPIRRSLNSMAKDYFTYHWWDDRRIERRKKASLAVLNSSKTKEKQIGAMGCEGRLKEESKAEPVTQSSSPVFFYIRDGRRLIDMSSDHKFLKGFQFGVKEKRKAGECFVLIIAVTEKEIVAPDAVEDSMVDNDFDNDLPGRMEAYTVAINHSKLNGSLKRHYSRKEIQNINVRQLKRLLLQRAPHMFPPKTLEPPMDWAEEDFGQSLEPMGNSLWPVVELRRAVVQIVGRGLGRSGLTLTDVRIVLLRTGLCVVSNEKPKPIDQIEPETWETRIRNAKKHCNPFELEILSTVVNPDQIDVTYNDVILDQETKDTVKHMVALSKFNPEAKSSLLLSKLRIKGALFYGPPGTGKTHLCRAIAKDSGSVMIAIDAATINSKWVGETEKYIKASFTLAAKLSPCVLFIDESDSLFYRRSSKDESWQRSAVTQFLQQMDGLSNNTNSPFVIAATNRPSDLDEAFLRRLPQKIYFRLPDELSRAKIFEIYLKREDLEPAVDMSRLAKITEGYSGSDIRNVCAEAAMIWMIEQVKASPIVDVAGSSRTVRLSVFHFIAALNKIRPSVTKRALRDLVDFAKHFNPGAFEVREQTLQEHWSNQIRNFQSLERR